MVLLKQGVNILAVIQVSSMLDLCMSEDEWASFDDKLVVIPHQVLLYMQYNYIHTLHHQYSKQTTTTCETNH